MLKTDVTLIGGLQPMVEASKQKVYKNLNGVVPIDESSVFGVPVPKSFLHQDHLKSESVDIQGVNIPLLQQGILSFNT